MVSINKHAKQTTAGTVILAITLLSARADQTNSVINWGKPVCGVQMSDELQNSVVAANSFETMCLKLKNSSTNTITLNGDTNSSSYFFLTNNIGRKYELRPSPYDLIDYGWDWAVKPGETKEFCIKVIIGKEVEPGDYTLVTDLRDITIAGGNVCRLVPGVQTVHVRPSP